MSDENFELVLPQELDITEFDNQVNTGRSYVPQLKLLQSQSGEVQENPGVDMPGQFYYNGEDNLGNEVMLIPMSRSVKVPAQPKRMVDGQELPATEETTKVVPCYRPHALLLVDREVEGESFNPSEEQFGLIRAEALSKKKVEGRAPMFGVDMLFWLPMQNDFAVYYFAKTARRQAKAFYNMAAAGKPILLKDHKIVARFTWWVPKAHPMPQAMLETMIGEGSRPKQAAIKEAMLLFYQPLAGASEEAIEEASASETGARER
jgi:hypothetical protein